MSVEGYTETKLKDLSVDGKGNYGIGASAVNYSEILPTYLRITDITDDGELKCDDMKSVSDENAEKYYLKPDDIVFARTGNSTGKSYFYDERDGKLVYAGFLVKFSLDKNKVLPRFMKYYTLTDEYKGWVQSFSTGSTRGNINAQMFGDMTIKLPDRQQQQLIVNTLDALYEKVRLNNQINKKLEEIAQAIFKSWFVDFEPFKGGEFEESELGLIPKRWRVGTLGEIAYISTDAINPKSNPDTVFEHFSIPLFDEGKISAFEKGDLIKSNKYVIDDNCMLFSKLNPQFKRVFKPLCKTSKAVCSTEFMVYRTIKPVFGSFIYSILRSESFYQFILQNVTGTTNSRQRAIPRNTLNYRIIIPDEFTLLNYDQVISEIYNYIQRIPEDNKLLISTRDTLLPKLMSGEIRVPS